MVDKYQEILKLEYVNKILQKITDIKIVKFEEQYYIKEYNQNLFLIKEDSNTKRYSELRNILCTFIHFEKYKKVPIESYIEISKNKYNHHKQINLELLKQLQFQYIIDKSYFENL